MASVPPVDVLVVIVVGNDPAATAAKGAPHDFQPFSSSLRLGLVPEQSPVHPENAYPESAVARSPGANAHGILTEHVAPLVPQLMPRPFTVPPDGRVTPSPYRDAFTVRLVDALAVVYRVVSEGVKVRVSVWVPAGSTAPVAGL